MRLHYGEVRIAATDLSNHLFCEHLTSANLAVARGDREAPIPRAPDLIVLQQRGIAHERAYIEKLSAEGLTVVEIGDVSEQEAIARTTALMAEGTEVIVQGALSAGTGFGKPDVLRKCELPSRFGPWSYEPYDCKLAKETKAATILQLSHYAELLRMTQGCLPESMYVVPPTLNCTPERYRVLDYSAYYRAIRRRLEIALESPQETYPEPNEHCDVCRWWTECDRLWRRDDHLSLVAGISHLQRKQLAEWDTHAMESLSRLPIPLTRTPRYGSKDGYIRVREQARIQVAGRRQKAPLHEVLPIEEGRGFCRLPEPSPGDLFFDLESDPFAGPNGREYLFGVTTTTGAYEKRWAFSASEEKAAFEWFVDFVMTIWERHPGMHIFHFGHKEPSTVKMLMGRYATRESEIDRWLRAGLMVDLHSVLKQSARASVEQYSLKAMEDFYDFERALPLDHARVAIRQLEHALELERIADISDTGKQLVETYNADDCRSTAALRYWLETIREQQIAAGSLIPRPVPQEGDAPENVTERQLRVLKLTAELQNGVPADARHRTPEQSARWLLANLLDWHRREAKVAYWERYRLRDLSDDDLQDERSAIAGLTLSHEIPPQGRKRLPLHEYNFPPQETTVEEGDALYARDVRIGTVEYVDPVKGIVGVRKTGAALDLHPSAAYTYRIVEAKELEESLFRIGQAMASQKPVGTAGSLLLRSAPKLQPGSTLRRDGESLVDAAERLVTVLDGAVLAIQGPPGTGKTFSAARMILAGLAAGKRIGVTATSHKVIRNVLDAVQKAAQEAGRAPVSCVHKITERSDTQLPTWLQETDKNQVALKAIQDRSCQVLAGTAWLWAREEAAHAVDILFIDEAGQMSLANALAVSPAAANLVLLGDPQQLDQPLRGSHPEGAEVSTLEHILHDAKTMPAGHGLFLDETWRLHPSICAFTSESFYENLLRSHTGLEHQLLEGHPWLGESGLRYLPVRHDGNQNSALEEVESIAQLTDSLLTPEVYWIDDKKVRRRLQKDDILIVAPYNAQVAALTRQLPGFHIGTVDKFQGQQAPVVIYSMTTSSPEDAPRGIEFLYSLNRLNVATSRAKAMSIVVASPKLLEPECKSPRQMHLANVLCRFVELSGTGEETWRPGSASHSTASN